MLKKGFLVTLIVFCLLVVVTTSALALLPEFYEGEYVGEPYIMADCRDYGYNFDIEVIESGQYQGKVFYNRDGSIDRIQEHVSGIDVMVNSESNKQISGNWVVNDVYVPIADDSELAYRHGLSYHVTYPGLGNVALDAGMMEIIIRYDENGNIVEFEIIRLKGKYTINFTDDFEMVCAALAD